tara:strand:- start:240 stop:407 length:168 start_codon:yes stop_codon:yes gene_type:complete
MTLKERSIASTGNNQAYKPSSGIAREIVQPRANRPGLMLRPLRDDEAVKIIRAPC